MIPLFSQFFGRCGCRWFVHGCFFPDIKGAPFLTCDSPVSQALLARNATGSAMTLDKKRSLDLNITTGDIPARGGGFEHDVESRKCRNITLKHALPKSIQSFTGKAHP
ncbi:hypothetical protein ACFQFQ_27855 [Sulfitobacter porphyrae]|uniref:Uncharacterized protein n=1 Tax=Sulfitobacter porphyrae TaxID=1246864 RepID=A0ABW2BB73_9RHOB